MSQPESFDNIFDLFNLIIKFYKYLKKNNKGNFTVPSKTKIGTAFGGLGSNYSYYENKKHLPNLWGKDCSDEYISNEIFKILLEEGILPQETNYKNELIYFFDLKISNFKIKTISYLNLKADLKFYKSKNDFENYIKSLIEFLYKAPSVIYNSKTTSKEILPISKEKNIKNHPLIDNSDNKTDFLLEDIQKINLLEQPKQYSQKLTFKLNIINFDFSYSNKFKRLKEYLMTILDETLISSYNKILIEDIGCINCETIKRYFNSQQCSENDIFLFISFGLNKHLECLKALSIENKVTIIVVEPNISFINNKNGILNFFDKSSFLDFKYYVFDNDKTITISTNESRLIKITTQHLPILIVNDSLQDIYDKLESLNSNISLLININDKIETSIINNYKNKIDYMMIIDKNSLIDSKTNNLEIQKILSYQYTTNKKSLISFYPDNILYNGIDTFAFDLSKLTYNNFENDIQLIEKWIFYIFSLFKNNYKKSDNPKIDKFHLFKLEDQLKSMSSNFYNTHFSIFKFEKIMNRIKKSHFNFLEDKYWQIFYNSTNATVLKNLSQNNINNYLNNVEINIINNIAKNFNNDNKETKTFAIDELSKCFEFYKNNNDIYKYYSLSLNLYRYKIDNAFRDKNKKESLKKISYELFELYNNTYNLEFKIRLYLLILEIEKELCSLTTVESDKYKIMESTLQHFKELEKLINEVPDLFDEIEYERIKRSLIRQRAIIWEHMGDLHSSQ